MAKYINVAGVNARLLAYLKTGRDITANQARQRFGITNVSQRIEDLRLAGYAIYCNTKKTSNGRTIRAYRLGTPTKAMIAAAYRSQRPNSGNLRYAEV